MASCGLLGGKWSPKRCRVWLLGGNINPQNSAVLGFWGKVVLKTVPCWAFRGKVVPKTVPCWAFGGKVVPKRRRFFKPACQKLPQHDALSSVSLKLKQTVTIWNWNWNSLTVFPLPLFLVSFCKHSQEQSTLLSNTQTSPTWPIPLHPYTQQHKEVRNNLRNRKVSWHFYSLLSFLIFLRVDTMLAIL